jgi:3-oxoacyl-[acyl-carrier-protein] synthase III
MHPSPFLPARPFTLIGTGVAVPPTVVTTEELDRRLGLAPGENFRVTGIRRRHSSTTETAAQLAAAAIRAALADAQLEWEDIDCLVCASATMDQALPYNAAMILAEPGLERRRRVTSLDIGASCLSFLHAVDLMSLALAAGRHRNVLIVSADVPAFTTDHANARDNGIFGDGAAAAVFRRAEPGEPSRVLAAHSITLSEGVDYCRIRSGGSRFHRRGDPSHSDALFEMRGRRLYALVARELPVFVDDLLARAGLTRADITLLIPHQASRQALDHVERNLGYTGRMVDVFAEFGNQVGASLPTALHFARLRHGLTRGQTALLLGTGAGVSIGGVVLTV